MTTLELQAQNIVRDDDSDDVQITDQAKYDALVESRKNRRAVSCYPSQPTYLNLNELPSSLGRVLIRLSREAGQGIDANGARIAVAEHFDLSPQQDGQQGRTGQPEEV